MSRSKFIVVVAASLTILPVSAFALGPYEREEAKKDEPKVEQAEAREMTKAMLSKAFKNFSATLDSKTKTAHLTGVTSKECMDLFSVSTDADEASFRVEFKGGPASCLSTANLKCADTNTCAKLSEKQGAALDLDAMSEGAKKDAKDVKIVLP